MIHPILQVLLCALLGYALGNFNAAFLLGRAGGYDLREEGTKNLGATNAFILLGKKAFFLTALLDILKAFAAWTLCGLLFPELLIAPAIGGAACVIGHIYPALLGFRGGKGLASIGGVILAWDWKWFLLLLALTLAIVFLTRYVCLAAPAISLIFPACFYLVTGLLLSALILLIPSVPIFARHWENFVRIAHGEEMRTSFLWNKEGELKRIGQWNDKTASQLRRRGRRRGE